jgi:hypothetical protein
MIHRIYVDLPDAQNRMKILKILLAKENLESEFGFDELANATEGYSGSDLKVPYLSHHQLFYSSSPNLPDVHLCYSCVTLYKLVWCIFLQNLCIAAAYRPVHELLEEENKVSLSCFSYWLLQVYSSWILLHVCSHGCHLFLGG